MTTGVMILAGLALTYLIPYKYEGSKSFEAMHLIGTPAPIKQVSKQKPLSAEELTRSRFDVIRERGIIRVGYLSNSLPYSFRNNKAELVGYDMEIMHELANDLDLKIEFSHIKQNNKKAEMLSDGRVDIVIGGHAITPKGALKVTFTNPYLHHTAGVIVLDSLRDEFSTIDKINGMKNLTIAVLNSVYYNKKVKKYFPHAKQITVSNAREYFKGMHKEADALVYSTESGSAWSILYPKYTALVPKGLKLTVPAAFVLPKGESAYAEYINTWLNLKKDNGFMDEVYNYWIMGINPEKKKTRWSVVHNVFGWDIQR